MNAGKLLWVLGAAAVLAPAGIAKAESESAVDVTIHDAPRPFRILAIEWNPIPAFTIGKLSANAIITPIDHHGLILSPFYASVDTNDIFVEDPLSGMLSNQLPVQKFRGYGGEIGYRYYTYEGGPRGFFFGPSLILGQFKVTAGDGSELKYLNYGIAGDAGFQSLVADRVSVSLGVGLQYLAFSKTIPPQQFPARFYANGGILPRFLLSIGWAL